MATSSPPSQKPPLYGVVVVGPPGAGKSTMCAGLARYLELAKRPSAVINLDPACEGSLTPFSIDVRNLCRVETVMKDQKLGANGALMYCVKVLRESPWLCDRLSQLGTPYAIFDLPGQVELWTHSDDLKEILKTITRYCDARLVVANVVDANHCTRPGTFIANALVSLLAMLNLELPHINVLSKIDQLPRFQASMPFHLNYFADAVDLRRLLPFCRPGDAPGVYDHSTEDDDDDDDMADEDPEPTGSVRLTSKICDLVEDFNLVCFQPLDITDGDSVANLVRMLDKANGHPAGVYEPPRLIDDATTLFLGTEQPPEQFERTTTTDDGLPKRVAMTDDHSGGFSSSTKSLRRSRPCDDKNDDLHEATRRWLKERR